MTKSFANSDVLAFYRELPFNYRESADKHAQVIRDSDAIASSYPVLAPLLRRGGAVLDVGCGAGWFSLSAAYHYGSVVTGIDFNDVAISRARDVAHALGIGVQFHTADLFQFQPTELFDLVVSIGVLHHTDNCLAGVRRLFNAFVKPGGHVFIGLYHVGGRRPFLEHFRRMRAAGSSEQDMLIEYKRLHPLADETHLRSWFRDQVLHPHETQHKLAEMLPILDETGMILVSTSINRFAPIEDISALLQAEMRLEQLAVDRLAEGRYFPGFFVFLARKG